MVLSLEEVWHLSVSAGFWLHGAVGCGELVHSYNYS